MSYYTCVRENVLPGLKNIGAETKLFGLHSLPAGGATAAANLEVNDRIFKIMEDGGQKKLKMDTFTQVLKRN